MNTESPSFHTFVTTKQNPLGDTFPLYTLYVGLGMYAIYYIVTFIYLGFIDQSLVLSRIIWIGTYITPYIFHFWMVCAFLILVILLFRDYRRGFRQIKLEAHQITLYPKQKNKELQIISWEHPIQAVFLSEKLTSLKVDAENKGLLLPSNFYPAAVLKITQFYDADLVNEELNDKSEFQDED
jgi:hypothetical protein